ncbi:hypothetical protein JCM15831A_15720 [Asaia astilbis]
MLFEGDAALRDAASRREVQKDRRPPVADNRSVVPAQNHAEIITMVITPQPLMTCRMGESDLTVVIAMARVIAPSVVGAQGFDPERSTRALNPVRAIKDVAERKKPGGGCLISFHLVCPQPTCTDESRNGISIEKEHAGAPIYVS